jgi:GT2 family glycosyltransferase
MDDRRPEGFATLSMVGDRKVRLSVIVVNYNSWPDVVRLVDAVFADSAFSPDRCEVVVVDNASRGPIPGELSRPRPGLRLVARDENGGFAVGVNAGWRESHGSWLLLLNPDVEIEPGFLNRVLDRLDEIDVNPADSPGIVGFGLKNPDGTRQGSVGIFPSLGRTVLEQFIPRVRRKYQADWRVRPGRVDWVTGACMLVNSRMIAELKGMDEDFFLYHEEVAFSRAALNRGWRTDFDPAVGVIHHSPLQNRAVSPKMRVITRHSKLLYFLKHLPRWQFLGLFGIVAGEASLKRRIAVLAGRDDDARAWRAIGEIARSLRRGKLVRGRDVLLIAEAVEFSKSGGGEKCTTRPTIAAEESEVDEKDWIS